MVPKTEFLTNSIQTNVVLARTTLGVRILATRAATIEYNAFVRRTSLSKTEEFSPHSKTKYLTNYLFNNLTFNHLYDRAHN